MPASFATALEAASGSIRRPRRAGWLAAFLVGPVLAVACGSQSTGDGAPEGSRDDSGAVVPPDEDATLSNPPPFVDGLPPDAGGPLQARIQLNAVVPVCGGCAVIAAQVQGGARPYTYAWSDPSLSGPGPFQVCPKAPTEYSLKVTDSSAVTSGEIMHSAQTASAKASVDCIAAGDANVAGLSGCQLLGSQAADGGISTTTDSGAAVECTQDEVEGGVAWADGGAVSSTTAELPFVLLGGHAYQVSYDRLLPISFGNPVTVDIFGANEPDTCLASQKLFTLNLDGSLFTWHQSHCFTPDRDYRYVITRVFIQGVYLYFNFLAYATLCDACTGL